MRKVLAIFVSLIFVTTSVGCQLGANGMINVDPKQVQAGIKQNMPAIKEVVKEVVDELKKDNAFGSVSGGNNGGGIYVEDLGHKKDITNNTTHSTQNTGSETPEYLQKTVLTAGTSQPQQSTNSNTSNNNSSTDNNTNQNSNTNTSATATITGTNTGTTDNVAVIGDTNTVTNNGTVDAEILNSTQITVTKLDADKNGKCQIVFQVANDPNKQIKVRLVRTNADPMVVTQDNENKAKFLLTSFAGPIGTKVNYTFELIDADNNVVKTYLVIVEKTNTEPDPGPNPGDTNGDNGNNDTNNNSGNNDNTNDNTGNNDQNTNTDNNNTDNNTDNTPIFEVTNKTNNTVDADGYYHVAADNAGKFDAKVQLVNLQDGDEYIILNTAVPETATEKQRLSRQKIAAGKSAVVTFSKPSFAGGNALAFTLNILKINDTTNTDNTDILSNNAYTKVGEIKLKAFKSASQS